MKVYKEIKEITKCNGKIRSLAQRLEKKMDTDGVDWSTAVFDTMGKKDIERLELVDDEYYVQQWTGYIEDDFYGYLYFKTDVPGQYVKVYFHM